MKKYRKLLTVVSVLIVLISSTSISFTHSNDSFTHVDAISSATKNEEVEVIVNIPKFDVRVNDTLIDTVHSQYPVITYKDITYFPMTYDYLAGIGLTLEFDETKGLAIAVNDDVGTLEQNFLGASNVLGSHKIAILAPFNVRVNGNTIINSNQEYPVLLYKDITYFPMTWRFAVTEFGWKTSWSDETGFAIVIEK